MAALPMVDASRLGEHGGSAARFASAWRRAAWAGSAALLWGLAGALSWALAGRADPFLLLGIAGAVALVGVILALARASRPAALALTAALALAASGHLLHANGAALRPFFPPALASGASGVLLVLAALVVAPLLAGWRAHALSLALSTTGRKPRFLPLRALDARSGADLLRAPDRPWLGALRRLGEGYLLPGASLMDIGGRALRVGADTLHGRLEPEAAARALVEAGFAVEPARAGLVVTTGEAQGGARVRVRPVPLALSPQGGIEVRGPFEARRAVRRVLESDASAAIAMCWTEAGRRLEAKLDTLLREAQVASSLEERSALYEEAQRVERVLESRDLLHDDWVALRAWKAHRLRASLAHRLLGEPVGPRTEGRILAPAPALRPDLARVMDAGGLLLLPRLVYVPHWIVPVRSPWGELDVLVNALTGKPHPEGDALLAASREQGAGLMLDLPRGVRFLPAGEPTAALLRDLREALPRGVDVARASEGPIEWLLVPHVPGPEGYIDAVTGAAASDLGPPAAVAQAAS